MMRSWTALALLCFGLSACKSHHPTVAIDGWWSNDYAKNACDQYKSMGSGYCDGNVIAATIKNEFATSFRANPACKNVVLYTGFTNPKVGDV
jgi:hypothetical protein